MRSKDAGELLVLVLLRGCLEESQTFAPLEVTSATLAVHVAASLVLLNSNVAVWA
jgi:hypothetical protein